MRALSIVLASCLCLAMAGCVQHATLVNVNSDGSGTITLRLMKSEKSKGSILDMVSKDQDDAVAKQLDKLDGTEKNKRILESYARQFGEGVKLDSFEEISKQGWAGYLVTFTFADIREIEIPATFSEKKEERTPFRFDLTQGEINKLAISIGADRGGKSDQQSSTSQDPFDQAGLTLTPAPKSDFGFSDAMAIGVAKMALRGARFSTLIKINGKVLDTNAKHRPNQETIVLQDFDVGEFAGSDEFATAVTEKWSYKRLIEENVPGLTSVGVNDSVIIKFSSKGD